MDLFRMRRHVAASRTGSSLADSLPTRRSFQRQHDVLVAQLGLFAAYLERRPQIPARHARQCHRVRARHETDRVIGSRRRLLGCRNKERPRTDVHVIRR